MPRPPTVTPPLQPPLFSSTAFSLQPPSALSSSSPAPIIPTQPSVSSPVLTAPPSVKPKRRKGRTSAEATATRRSSRLGPSSAVDAPLELRPCAQDAPQWFRLLYELVTEIPLGHEFTSAVNAWIRMEEASFTSHPEPLPARSIPAALSTWLKKSKRSRRLTPAKLAPFVAAWTSWWDGLQPVWRRRGLGGTWRIETEYGGEGKQWGDLFTWGEGGVGVIIAGLYLWGCSVESDDGQAVWRAAVVDVAWILEGMAIYYEKFTKRGIR
ncbi:hypothetical protein C8F01DRAFT_987054 [Mycena amicta]|nr:hypothetical protein C8F01DRAFT_987054 [Mycena amicta]